MKAWLVAYGLLIGCPAEEPPPWVLPAIAYVETKSILFRDLVVKYEDQRRGKSGEIGPFQVGPAAFRDAALSTEKFLDMQTDMTLAVSIATRYLKHIHIPQESWLTTCEHYQAGPGRRNLAYRHRIEKARACE